MHVRVVRGARRCRTTNSLPNIRYWTSEWAVIAPRKFRVVGSRLTFAPSHSECRLPSTFALHRQFLVSTWLVRVVKVNTQCCAVNGDYEREVQRFFRYRFIPSTDEFRR